MPNMFGGSQSHPSYDPRTKVLPSEDLVGNTLWKAAEVYDSDEWKFVGEDPDGSLHIQSDPPTKKLREYIKKS